MVINSGAGLLFYSLFFLYPSFHYSVLSFYLVRLIGSWASLVSVIFLSCFSLLDLFISLVHSFFFDDACFVLCVAVDCATELLSVFLVVVCDHCICIAQEVISRGTEVWLYWMAIKVKLSVYCDDNKIQKYKLGKIYRSPFQGRHMSSTPSSSNHVGESITAWTTSTTKVESPASLIARERTFHGRVFGLGISKKVVRRAFGHSFWGRGAFASPGQQPTVGYTNIWFIQEWYGGRDLIPGDALGLTYTGIVDRWNFGCRVI